MKYERYINYSIKTMNKCDLFVHSNIQLNI